jgi:hypothetical protein
MSSNQDELSLNLQSESMFDNLLVGENPNKGEGKVAQVDLEQPNQIVP